MGTRLDDARCAPFRPQDPLIDFRPTCRPHLPPPTFRPFLLVYNLVQTVAAALRQEVRRDRVPFAARLTSASSVEPSPPKSDALCWVRRAIKPRPRPAVGPLDLDE